MFSFLSKNNRTRAILVSFAATAAFNTIAGLLTLAYVNGTTIIETNQSSLLLLRYFGAGAILVHVVEIGLAYPLAYLVSKLISSKRRLFNSKRIYLYSFALMVFLLPVAAFIDMLNDVLVVLWSSNLVVGSEGLGTVAFVAASVVAAFLTMKGWTMPPTKPEL